MVTPQPRKHCPACGAQGIRSKVKSYFINLELDIVVMCEREECTSGLLLVPGVGGQSDGVEEEQKAQGVKEGDGRLSEVVASELLNKSNTRVHEDTKRGIKIDMTNSFNNTELKKSTSGGKEVFDKVLTRDDESKNKLLRKVAKNNKKLKKYRGFGEAPRVKKDKVKAVKKAAVPAEEADIIAELLEAVAMDWKDDNSMSGHMGEQTDIGEEDFLSSLMM